jgi:hypothetical protein
VVATPKPKRGRPPLAPEERNARERFAKVRASADELARWQAAAEELGTTLSAVARAAWERLATKSGKEPR